MQFSDFLCVEAIRPNLQATTKEDVIRELVEGFVDAGHVNVDDEADIIKAIMSREELGTTAIGKGFAIPHVKHPTIDRIVGSIVISTTGVEFNSLDGSRTEIFFLLLSPIDTPTHHLRAMEKVSRHLKNNMFCRFLKQCRTVAEAQDVLSEADHPELLAHA